SPSGPAGTWPALENFQSRARADLLDQLEESVRLLAVAPSRGDEMSRRLRVQDRQLTPHAEQYVLRRVAAVGTQAELRLAPCQHGDVAEAPLLQQSEGEREHAVRRPEVKVRILIGQPVHRQ